MKINKHRALSIVTFSVFEEKKDDTNVDTFYCACFTSPMFFQKSELFWLSWGFELNQLSIIIFVVCASRI